MKIQELKYNLFLVEFRDIEQEIHLILKKELSKYGFLTSDELPRADYVKLLNYFTFLTLCKAYNSLEHKKNTIFYVYETETDSDILKIVKEMKKHFPVLIYTAKMPYNTKDIAVKTEITMSLKEFRYSLDYSKYSFNKIKKFCKKFELENLITDFRI